MAAAAGWLLPTADCLLPTAYYLLPTADRRLELPRQDSNLHPSR